MDRDRELTCNHSASIEQDVIARQTVNSFTYPTIAPTHSHAKNLEIYEGHTERTHIHTHASHIAQIYILTSRFHTHVHILEKHRKHKHHRIIPITHTLSTYTPEAHAYTHMHTNVECRTQRDIHTHST